MSNNGVFRTLRMFATVAVAFFGGTFSLGGALNRHGLGGDWFKNPLSFLSSFGPAVLVAQSDEYNITGPINLHRPLNYGFYYANSDGITITTLEKVVMHAVKSNLSEQPSFYDTLCGEGGSNCLGDNRCLEPETNLTVYFLNRYLFPNCAYCISRSVDKFGSGMYSISALTIASNLGFASGMSSSVVSEACLKVG